MKAIDKAIEVTSFNEKYDAKRLAIAIREKINEENDAINSYMSLIPHLTDSDMISKIEDIANEEKLHVGELKYMLYNLDPSELQQEEKGVKEASE